MGVGNLGNSLVGPIPASNTEHLGKDRNGFCLACVYVCVFATFGRWNTIRELIEMCHMSDSTKFILEWKLSRWGSASLWLC